MKPATASRSAFLSQFRSAIKLNLVGPLLLLVSLLSLSAGGAAAQQNGAGSALPSVRGSVVDADGRAPLTNAQVAVRRPGDTAVLTGATTDQSGRFTIQGIAPGQYELTVTYLGYGPATTPVSVTAGGEAVALAPIVLTRQAVALADITVVAERSAVVVAADRDIYAVEAIPGAAGGSATDVLQNIPDLQVDVDGAITLRGATPTIYINGRPAPMTGEALAIFLQGYAAENIENVEVMPNPSARYEAQGGGGIVNLVLRRGAGLGLSGNAFLNGGSRGELGIGGRTTYQQGPWTLMGGTSVRLTQTETNSSELRTNLNTNTQLGQYVLADRRTWNGNFDLNTEYALGPQTSLSAQTRIGMNAASADRVTTYREMDAAELILDEYDRTTVDEANGLSGNFALEFEHEFKNANELELQFEYERGRDYEQSRIRQRLLEDLNLAEYSMELTEDEDRETESEISFQADYIRPFGERTQVELGFQTEHGSTDERRWQQVAIEDSPEGPLPALQNGFIHSQTVNSLYLTLIRRMGDVNAQLGLRGERSNTTLGLPDGDVDVNDMSFFPNANITYNVGEGKRIRASYSMRIQRPSSNVLNPTNTSDDPLNLRTGNPEITPQFTHSYSLDGSWAGQLGTIRISPFYRRSVNEWERFKTVNEESGVATTTYANLGSTNTFGSSINLSVRDYKGIGGSINLNGQHQINNWDESMSRAAESSTRWGLQTNLNGRVTSDLSLQGSLAYNPGRDLPQGRTSSTIMTRLGLRQRVLDGRGSLNLNVTDPFEQYRPTTTTRDVNFTEQGSNRASIRSLSLSFAYNFGGRGRPAGQRGPGGPGGFGGPGGPGGGFGGGRP
jgi:hypothetical protein